MIFVSDFFTDEMPNGGSELSLDALIRSCPTHYKTIKSKALNLKEIPQDEFIIFGNFNELSNENLELVKCYKYVIIESDYKLCTKYRNPTIHLIKAGGECNCIEQPRAKLIEQFFLNSQHIFWKSAKQREWYQKQCPSLINKPDTILSAVFTQEDLDLMKELRDMPKNGKTAILKSNNITKDFRGNSGKCEEYKLEYEGINGLPYREFLKKLAVFSKFLYYPKGRDTCPRVVLESRMMGLGTILGDLVENQTEWWFQDLDTMEGYLRGRVDRFWFIIRNLT